MRKLACVLVIMMAFGMTAAAQDAPKADVFGGYSWLRVGGNNNIRLHGFNGSVSLNPTSSLGIVADFAVYHSGNIAGSGASGTITSYTFGPKFQYRMNRLQPYAQFLVGGAHANVNGDGVNSVAVGFGGGIDARINDRVSIRLFEGDFVATKFDGERQNNIRISTGIVLHFGKH